MCRETAKVRPYVLIVLATVLSGASLSCSGSRHAGQRHATLTAAQAATRAQNHVTRVTSEGISYRLRPKPYVVVVLDPVMEGQSDMRHVAHTPCGTVRVHWHDLHLTGLEGAPLSQNYYEVYVDAPKRLPVLLKVKFGPDFTPVHYDLFETKVNGRPARFQFDKKPPYLYGSMWLHGGRSLVGYGQA